MPETWKVTGVVLPTTMLPTLPAVSVKDPAVMLLLRVRVLPCLMLIAPAALTPAFNAPRVTVPVEASISIFEATVAVPEVVADAPVIVTVWPLTKPEPEVVRVTEVRFPLVTTAVPVALVVPPVIVTVSPLVKPVKAPVIVTAVKSPPLSVVIEPRLIGPLLL